MPSILNLKFKGNKSFVAFSNLNDTESLTKTWKVCTKVASYLEQGQRLENLSWRLWHLQNLMVDTDNAKSKRQFKKLSKCMGDKLDKEKGRIEELEAPDFKRNPNTDKIRQRAVEKERNREASQHALPGTIKRMQFTFSVDQPPQPPSSQPVTKPNFKPSAEFNKRTRAAVRASAVDEQDDMLVADDENDTPLTQRGRKPRTNTSAPQSLRFPSIFSSDFGPSALLYPTPTLTTPMNYGEGLNPSASNDGFSIMRPTIELPLDELLVDAADSPDVWTLHASASAHDTNNTKNKNAHPDSSEDVIMHSTPPVPYITIPARKPSPAAAPLAQESESDSSMESDDEDSDFELGAPAPTSSSSNSTSGARKRIPPLSQTVKEVLPETVAPSKVNLLYRASTPVGRPTLTVRTQATPTTRSSGPGATATSLNPAVLRGHAAGGGGGGANGTGNSAPGGVKAECTNCGATHTPLWRRGLNDELNCNACGLYCKLHKRPRPKSMRNTHGEGRTQVAPRQEAVDVMAQCYNCHTTATPLWRKDDEGKTVCNACGLYYKLHGSARPISMKSDVIRKRSRHDARRSANGLSDTPSASPGASRRASPVRSASPTLAPDSTTQMTYDYGEELDYRPSQSELLGALGQDLAGQGAALYASPFPFPPFPGPYHPDHLTDHIPQLFTLPQDPLPFAADSPEGVVDLALSPRTSKRRRMSTDSASEPPSSATSYSSYNDGYSTPASSVASHTHGHSHSHSHSHRSSMDFPFSSYLSGGASGAGPSASLGGGGSAGAGCAYGGGPALRGSGNTFWHPPMMPQGGGDADGSPHGLHPPMLPPGDESPMDYLHPPMVQDEDALFSAYLHPPMSIPAEEGAHMVHAAPVYGEYAGHEAYDNAMRVY